MFNRLGRVASLAFALTATIPGTALAEPSVGARMPSFRVNDLTGSTRTERDLVGGWSVVFAMTDKDVGADLTAWWRRVETSVPQGTRMYTFVALDLFPLIPTATIVSQARDSTPRARWNTVWLSRDGSFARSLGLPEVEMPWVFVIDPSGRVAAALHERVTTAGLNRVIAALTPTP